MTQRAVSRLGGQVANNFARRHFGLNPAFSSVKSPFDSGSRRNFLDTTILPLEDTTVMAGKEKKSSFAPQDDVIKAGSKDGNEYNSVLEYAIENHHNVEEIAREVKAMSVQIYGLNLALKRMEGVLEKVSKKVTTTEAAATRSSEPTVSGSHSDEGQSSKGFIGDTGAGVLGFNGGSRSYSTSARGISPSSVAALDSIVKSR